MKCMKLRILFLFVVVFCSQVSAQNALVGSWEMVSSKITSPQGTKILKDNSFVRAIKIITPTYFISFSEEKVDKNLAYFYQAGTVKLVGEKFIESPEVSSRDNFRATKTDFNWKVKDGKFIQSGDITFPSGDKFIVDEMIYRIIKVKTTNDKNPSIGVWKLVSAAIVGSDGTKIPKMGVSRILVINATHWMQLNYAGPKVQNSSGGTYMMDGGKLYPSYEYSSIPMSATAKHEFIQKVEGDKLYLSGFYYTGGGSKIAFSDVYQRAK